MAEKKTTIKAPASSPKTSDDDLTVLHPERSVTIAGRQLTVREYGFLEGLRLRSTYQPMINDLATLISGPDAPIAQIICVLSNHAELLVQLMAQSADVEPEFIEGLNDEDGSNLLRTWWLVNCHFFLRQARDHVITTRLANAARAGQTHTKPSSSTATHLSESVVIPSDK